MQFQVLRFHRQGTEVELVVCKRMLEINYLYSFLCLTKIVLLFRRLNMHLLRITLAHRGTSVGVRENRNLRSSKIAPLFRCLNMHLLKITLAHCDTLARNKLLSCEAAVKNSETHIIRISGSVRISRATISASRLPPVV